MDELENVLADTSDEELTGDKKVQYSNVSCSFFVHPYIIISFQYVAGIY